MTPKKIAALSALGMLLTSFSVYSLTPPGGRAGAETVAEPDPTVVPSVVGGGGEVTTELGRFVAGGTLMVEGRLGHQKLLRSDGETFLMLEVKNDGSSRAETQAPANLSLVIDRSGSMKGGRLQNALQAATRAVDQLQDGDVVSVVAFDTRTNVIVPPTTIGPGTRGRVISDIRGITLGGDTCISCGIEEGLALLERTEERVSRMLLLSDGDANNGVRDVPGFRSIAQRAHARGVSITTIGVDVEYNEKILAAIAQDSNGRHYFAENDSGLSRIFEEEAEALKSTVASGVEVAVDLAPGVELERVFDRSFRREGNRVMVPLGSFSRGEVKTALLKVRLSRPELGEAKVAEVSMTYRDLVGSKEGRCEGKLALEVTDDRAAASALDALVAGRVQRSETASTLQQANFLFKQGRFEEARKKLDTQRSALKGEASRAKTAAPMARAADVSRDFDRQIAVLESADKDFNAPRQFATPPPPAGMIGGAAPAPAAPAEPAQESRAGRSAVKRNESNAFDLGL
ncbi:vWA domain-containing protein [Chondromyces apiculatus]|uniref:VWFA domain-containing protein n=1 Tax=Chondromyces apiculatus DSM 436 TaxID=1192034 RepID=A0A017TFZ0_9BACT|nr:VWA domain-containing protein [Chondromyces apiculatus]EYF07740.1 Hypothetical protein CAP_8241 [Chondromyces apiculatus DSM 436]